MGRSTTDTCCLTLPLKIEKWQADRLEKRLEIARQIYNTLLKHIIIIVTMLILRIFLGIQRNVQLMI